MAKEHGHISYSFTFWCGDVESDCQWWDMYGGSKKNTIVMARHDGWKKTREFGWLCPMHATNDPVVIEAILRKRA